MTNSIVQSAALICIAPNNIKRKLPELKCFLRNPIDAECKKYFPDEVLRTYKKANEELSTTKECFYPILA